MITKLSVEQFIGDLDKKIFELKRKRPIHRTLLEFGKFSKKEIADWMEYYIDKNEENYEYNEEIMDKVLYWIQRINNILKNINEHISKSKLKLLIKEIIKEVTQQDITAVHPQRIDVWNKKWEPILSKMTLDNLKSLREKARRIIDHLKGNYNEENIIWRNYELERFKIYNDEINKRLKYINKPMLESQGIFNNQRYYGTNCTGTSHGVSSDYNDVQLVRDPLNDPRLNNKLDEENNYRTKHFFVKWGEPDIIRGAGKVFLGDKWFANAVKVAKDWNPKYANKWWINRHEEAFKLNFPSQQIYFDDVRSLLDYLEKWYQSREKDDAAYTLHRVWKSLRHGD